MIMKLQRHLDKAKTITTKSKLKMFREQLDSEHEHMRADKLREIVKRTHKNVSLSSSQNT
jgi:hypothetical protein